MAVGWLGRARDERHVQPAGAKLHHRFTGRAFGDLDFNIGVILAVLADQLCEEAMRNQGMDTDTKPAAFSGCRHAGGFHRMVELVNTYGYPLDEMASGLGQPNAARMTLEQEDAEVFFQCLHAGADAGLCNAERVGGVTEKKKLGDSESVN
ncbi:Uncharacterised protein [Salmonella enterica subsp. enterica serovar Typhimurium str. DT104]|nr:Uncharacterised protein [Salmonella enterica subsp. enterica serovar Typhimurium str. DT104]